MTQLEVQHAKETIEFANKQIKLYQEDIIKAEKVIKANSWMKTASPLIITDEYGTFTIESNRDSWEEAKHKGGKTIYFEVDMSSDLGKVYKGINTEEAQQIVDYLTHKINYLKSK